MKRYGWHFLKNNWHTNKGDLPVVIGEKLVFVGEPRLEVQGLHASDRIRDALIYACGNIITYVECEGTIIEDGYATTKFVCTERTALWGFDAEHELKVFSRRVAKDALATHWSVEKFGPLPPLMTGWLETGNEELRSAAWSAARSAAESAARSAARSAAESAARSAAESAARSAAWSAARSAAWSAARSAAESAARSATWSAARSTAWSAARSAAESAHNDILEKLIVDKAIELGLKK